MVRNAFRVAACMAAVALVAGVFALPSSAATQAQAQGVGDEEIELVAIVPDLDKLRSQGVSLSPKLTTDFYLKPFQAYADDFGPINGRKVVVKGVGWDPVNTVSQTTSCTQATQDNKPFIVLNASGYRQAYIPCVTVDNDTPMISGDPGYADVNKASGKNLITYGLPSEVSGPMLARFLDERGLVTKQAKIGLLSNNDPQIKATADTMEKEFEKRGYNVVSKIELNGLAADSNVLQREATTAAGTMQADGVDTVIHMQSFTGTSGFFEEAIRSNWKPKIYMTDGQADTCTVSGAQRVSAAIADLGLQCVTTFDARVLPDKSGLKPDNPAEAKCRELFDEQYGAKSFPTTRNGDTTINGVNYVSDMQYNQCNIMSVLLPAMKKAGKNLTWDKVYKNILNTKEAPAVYMSNGEGGFAKNKPYFASQVHLVTLTGAGPNTAQDPTTKLFNGCPGPWNCFVPQLVDDKEWFSAKT